MIMTMMKKKETNNEDILDNETGIRKYSINVMKTKDYMLEEDNIESVDQQLSDSNFETVPKNNEENTA